MLTLSKIESSLSLSRPVELYLFEYGQKQYAYTTGSKQHLHTDGLVYTPLPIKRSSITRTQDDNKSSLQVTVPGNSEVPLIFLNQLPQNHVMLRVFRTNDYLLEQYKLASSIDGAVSSAYTSVFTGEVVQTRWNNTVAELTCAPVSALQRRQMLRMGYQAQCNNHVFDDLCTLKLTDWQETVTVTAIVNNGFTIVINSKSHPDDYYGAGLLSKNSSDFRTVTRVAGTSISLLSPFDGLKVGDQLELAKGCNGSASSCQSFGNFDNFLGCLNIPTDNPFQ